MPRPTVSRVGAPISFVRANGLLPFIDFLNSIGGAAQHLLDRSRIPARLVAEGEAVVPLFSAYRFIELIAREEDLRNLGAIVAQRASAFDLGAFGAALGQASTVYEYLRIGLRAIGSHSSQTRFWLESEGDFLRLHQSVQGPPGLGRCIADVYTLVLTVGMLRRFIGPGWSPGEVRLVAGAEGLVDAGAGFGGAPLVTGEAHSSFTIARRFLATPVPSGYGAGQSVVKSPVSGPPMPADFLSSIEQLVVTLLPEGYPSIQTVAESVGMSRRTLQRRLEERGVNYSSLLGACRIRLARQWLSQTDMPITEIAAALGYSEESNFSRAFRRRTGASPVEYRKGCAREDQPRAMSCVRGLAGATGSPLRD